MKRNNNVKRNYWLFGGVIAFLLLIIIILGAYCTTNSRDNISITKNAVRDNGGFIECDTEDVLIKIENIMLTCPYTTAYKVFQRDGRTHMEFIQQKFLTKLAYSYPKVDVEIYSTKIFGPNETLATWVRKNILSAYDSRGEISTENKIKPSASCDPKMAKDVGCPPETGIIGFEQDKFAGIMDRVTYTTVSSNGSYISTVINVINNQNKNIVFKLTNINSGLCDDSCDIANENYIIYLIDSIIFL